MINQLVKSLSVAWLFTLSLGAVAQGELPANIQQKMSELNVPAGDVSMWIEPIDGTPLVAHLADVPRMPASTQKLITTFMALDLLGKDHHWYTRVYQNGVVIDGTLYGDIVIKGEGDPALTHERLKSLMQTLPTKGIHHVKGDIVVDNRAFYGVARNVNAFDGHGLRAYNAQPNALLVNFGTIEVNLLPSGQEVLTAELDKKGDPVKTFIATDTHQVALNVLPKLADFDYPKAVNAQEGCASEPSFRLSSQALLVAGKAGVGCGIYSQWLTFADGDELALKAVKGAWQDIDSQFKGRVRLATTQDDPHGLPIISYPSRALSTQIYDINQNSNNVMTEQVALSMPLMAGQKVSTYPKTFALMNSWWQSHFRSVPPTMSRASGLCRDCRISVQAMGEMLKFAHQHPQFETFKQSLPIAGKTGTMAKLAYRNPTHPAIGRAFIKTGTLDDVAGMAGYVYDSQNKPYVVVGLINTSGAGARAVAVLDEMLATVASR